MTIAVDLGRKATKQKKKDVQAGLPSLLWACNKISFFNKMSNTCIIYSAEIVLSNILLPPASSKILQNMSEGWLFHISALWECSRSVVECLTRDRGAAGSSLTGVTALWSLSKTHLSLLSTGSTQKDLSLFN